jgi:hypothetical protein
VASDVHEECAELNTQGLTDAQITAKYEGREPGTLPPPPTVKPVTLWTIVLGVFIGQVLFALAAGITHGFISFMDSLGH